MTGPRAPRRSEEGSALVLALLFVVIFSLFIASVITFTDVGFKAAKAFNGQRQSSTAADGAVDAAINRFRGGQPCDDYRAPTDSSGQPVNGEGIIVRCKDVVAERPLSAVLSLGEDADEHGIASGVTDQRVRGDVYSNSTIDVAAGGAMVVEGEVSAAGSCSPNIQATTVNCPTVVGTRDRDPEFLKLANTVPKPQTVPVCGADVAVPWLVKLQPGYYDDDDLLALNALSTDAACDDAIVWMQPGLYYFDFSFKSGAPGTWLLNDSTVNVIAGTPKNWDPNEPATLPPDVGPPGGCVGPGEEAADLGSGVQVIVGGESRIQIDAGAVELCASAGSGDREIALYGLPPERPTQLLAPTSVSVSTNFVAGTVDNALLAGEIPESTANANLGAAGPTSASITLAGFGPSLPAGSRIDSAILKVRHQDDPGIDTTFSAGNCTEHDLSPAPVMAEEEFDLKACGIDEVAEIFGLTVEYEATLSSGTNVVDRLDGMWVEVSYRPPLTLKPTGSSGVGFVDPAGHALEIGEQPAPLTADVTLTAANPSASLTLTGFVDQPLPAEAIIDSAKLRVAHEDPAGVAPTVTVTGGTCTDRPLATHPALAEDPPIDLKSDCSMTFPGAFNNLAVTYKADLATGNDPSIDRLDGVWVEIAYRPIRRAATTTAVTQFADPDNALQIGEPVVVTSDAALSAGNPLGSLRLTGGFDLPALPVGAAIDSATLRVVHQEIGDVKPLTVTPSVAGTPCAARLLPPRTAALFNESVDLTACNLTPASLPTFEVQYDAELTPGGDPSTARLDGIELELTWRPTVVHKPATATSAPDDFANPDPNARAIAEQPTPLTSDANLTASDSVASVTLGGFDQPPLPSGAKVESAVLRVAHQDDPGVTVSLTTSIPGCGPFPLTSQVAMAVEPVPITSCLQAPGSGLAGFTVTYTADSAGAPAIDRLDGIELDILFRAPGFQRLSGCSATVPDPLAPVPPQTCAVLQSVASPSTRFLVDGTVYAPSAAIDLAMQDVTSQVVTRGLIARAIKLDIAAAFARPTLGVPNPETVTFEAYREQSRAATTATPGPVFTPAEADQAMVVDGIFADAHLDSGSPTASLTLENYDLVTPVPGGGDIDALMLRVTHRHTGDVAAVTITPDIPGETCTAQSVTAPDANVQHSLIDLVEACDLDAPVQLADLAGLTVNYTASLDTTASTPPQADVSLDGIALEALTGPMVRARVEFPLGESPRVEEWSVVR